MQPNKLNPTAMSGEEHHPPLGVPSADEIYLGNSLENTSGLAEPAEPSATDTALPKKAFVADSPHALNDQIEPGDVEPQYAEYEGDPDSADAEHNAKKREADIACILKHYQDHPQVWRKLEAHKKRPSDRPMILPNDDSLATLFAWADQFGLLETKEAEQTIFMAIEQGLEAFAATGLEDEVALIDLVVAHRVVHATNIRMVVQVAKRYLAAGFFSIDDTVQYGLEGLNKAIARFDYKKGFKFSTYSPWWIRQAIGKACADMGRTIRIPSGVHAQWVKIGRAQRQLQSELQREPTMEEVAQRTKMPAEKVEDTLKVGAVLIPSLDQHLDRHDTSSPTLGEAVPDKKADIDVLVEQLSAQLEMSHLFASDRLDDKQKIVLALRHGVSDYLDPTLKFKTRNGDIITYGTILGHLATEEKMTLEAVGMVLGLTRVRIQQIEKTALAAARVALRKDQAPSHDGPKS